MNKTKQITKLKKMVIAASFESTEAIYLKEPVIVGTTPKGNVLCVSVHRNFNPFYDNDDLYLDILYNEHDNDLYGNDFEFTPVCYLDSDKGKPSFLPEKLYEDYIYEHPEITMLPNALELVIEELEKEGQEWIDYQKNLRVRSRHYSRWATNPHRDKSEKLSWEERLEWTQVRGEIDHLMHRHKINHDFKTLERMKFMGEQAHDEADRKMMELLNSLNIKEKIEKKVKERKKEK